MRSRFSRPFTYSAFLTDSFGEELIRVSVGGASFEIWTPYLKSDEAFLLGHRHFYNETIWKHICIEYPYFWLKDVEATLRIDKFCYTLKSDAVIHLDRFKIPMHFALKHLFNIASEIGVFMTVIKGKNAKVWAIPYGHVTFPLVRT